VVATADRVQTLTVANAVPLNKQKASQGRNSELVPINYVVNNDGTYFPRVTASYTANNTSLAKVNDGNYWYLQHPPNRWTCENSPNSRDWIEVDFGMPRAIEMVKLYVLDDAHIGGSNIRPPQSISLEQYVDGKWEPLKYRSKQIAIEGRRPYTLQIEPMELSRFRVTLTHANGFKSGFTELEAWGNGKLPLEALPHPEGNLAFNDGTKEFPKVTASYHDRFGGVPASAIDGKTNFLPTPTNRWTSYESPNERDWLEIDFGREVEFGRVELAIYDDRGGVQTPLNYDIEVWLDGSWQTLGEVKRSPDKPAGSHWNSATFKPQKSSKLRIQFANRSPARSGVTEVMVWAD
jgi:hypothetical protein